MITLKELKQHYQVHKQEDRYCICDKNPKSGSRMVYKYLCDLVKDGRKGFKIKGTVLTYTKIETLQKAITSYAQSLPYDSEYYNSMYRPGTFELHIIIDYLADLGFVMKGGHSDFQYFELIRKNIYGCKSLITLSIGGLDTFIVPEEITVNLETGSYSYVTVKADREIKSIKGAINTLLKSLLLTNIANDIILADKIEDLTNVDVMLSKLKGVQTVLEKVAIKEKLLAAINLL